MTQYASRFDDWMDSWTLPKIKAPLFSSSAPLHASASAPKPAADTAAVVEPPVAAKATLHQAKAIEPTATTDSALKMDTNVVALVALVFSIFTIIGLMYYIYKFRRDFVVAEGLAKGNHQVYAWELNSMRLEFAARIEMAKTEIQNQIINGLLAKLK
jgi:hypothetical protein